MIDIKDDSGYTTSDRIMVVCLVLSYLCFVLSTFLQNDLLIRIFSPLTAILTGSLILKCLSRMGDFWLPSFILSMGIFMWALADVLILCNTLVFHSDAMTQLVRYVFLLPNYFFGASVAIYFIQKLKGRELYQFLINTFTLTVIALVCFKKVLEHLNSFETLNEMDLLRIYLYFFINLFIIIMIAHMTYMIASETGLKGTNTMIIGIAVYIILNIPYTYQQALGNDPSNNYENLIYMLCMMLMAHGIYHQIGHRHTFKLKGYTYSEASVKRTRILAVLGILIAGILFFRGIFNQNDFFYVLLALLAFWIMSSTFQNGALNEQLVKQRDLLTGLYNRRYAGSVLEESVSRAHRTGTRFAVYCIDLNNFKPINDFYGHDMGDNVLREFGQRMLSLDQDHIPFRTGGDEFMIVKNGAAGDEEIEEAAAKLRELFNTPVRVASYVFRLSGSIGVAVYPEDSEDPAVLLRYADAAMYSVKHSGHKDGYRLFDRSLVESVEKHKALETMLKDADPARDFELFYQPRFGADTGELIGAEAFLRLKTDETLNAAVILPIAEEVGLMNRLNIWIAKTGIKQLHKWNSGGRALFLSLNLSALQLLDQGFIDGLKSFAADRGMDASLIHLDIGNDVIMGAGSTAKETLQDLDRFGFGLDLNDFGGDDINLQRILDCGFSSIHMSPSLIRRSDTDEEARVLVRSIIALAKTMGIRVSAVGVETKEQEDFLKDLGIHSLQGYYYGKPQGPEEFEKNYLPADKK